eukprot:2908110-Pyramimonas_sp.AAC.1
MWWGLGVAWSRHLGSTPPVGGARKSETGNIAEKQVLQARLASPRASDRLQGSLRVSWRPLGGS